MTVRNVSSWQHQFTSKDDDGPSKNLHMKFSYFITTANHLGKKLSFALTAESILSKMDQQDA